MVLQNIYLFLKMNVFLEVKCPSARLDCHCGSTGWSPLNVAGVHRLCKFLRIPSGHCYAEGFIKYPMMNTSPRLLSPTPEAHPWCPSWLNHCFALKWPRWAECPCLDGPHMCEDPWYLVCVGGATHWKKPPGERQPPGNIWMHCERLGSPEGTLGCSLVMGVSALPSSLSKLTFIMPKTQVTKSKFCLFHNS